MLEHEGHHVGVPGQGNHILGCRALEQLLLRRRIQIGEHGAVALEVTLHRRKGNRALLGQRADPVHQGVGDPLRETVFVELLGERPRRARQGVVDVGRVKRITRAPRSVRRAVGVEDVPIRAVEQLQLLLIVALELRVVRRVQDTGLEQELSGAARIGEPLHSRAVAESLRKRDALVGVDGCAATEV